MLFVVNHRYEFLPQSFQLQLKLILFRKFEPASAKFSCTLLILMIHNLNVVALS